MWATLEAASAFHESFGLRLLESPSNIVLNRGLSFWIGPDSFRSSVESRAVSSNPLQHGLTDLTFRECEGRRRQRR